MGHHCHLERSRKVLGFFSFASHRMKRKSTHPSRQSLRFVPRHLPCQGKAFYMENNPREQSPQSASVTASSSKHSFSPLCAKGSPQDCCCDLRRRVRPSSKHSFSPLCANNSPQDCCCGLRRRVRALAMKCTPKVRQTNGGAFLWQRKDKHSKSIAQSSSYVLYWTCVNMD